MIQLGRKGGEPAGQQTTRLHRWNEVARAQLLEGLEYTTFDPSKWNGVVAKIGTPGLMQAFEQLAGERTFASLLERRPTKFPVYFKQSAYNWVSFSRQPPPTYDAVGKAIEPSMLGVVYLGTEEQRALVLSTLNSKAYFGYWLAVGDDFHLTKGNFETFPLIKIGEVQDVMRLADNIQAALNGSLTFKLNAGKRVGNYNSARCRAVTDFADGAIRGTLGCDAIEEVRLYIANTVKTDFGPQEVADLDEAA